MKITDRVKGIEGIDDAHWDNKHNRLVVYYTSPDLDLIKIKVAGAINDAFLHRAIEEITFISC